METLKTRLWGRRQTESLLTSNHRPVTSEAAQKARNVFTFACSDGKILQPGLFHANRDSKRKKHTHTHSHTLQTQSHTLQSCINMRHPAVRRLFCCEPCGAQAGRVFTFPCGAAPEEQQMEQKPPPRLGSSSRGHQKPRLCLKEPSTFALCLHADVFSPVEASTDAKCAAGRRKKKLLYLAFFFFF